MTGTRIGMRLQTPRSTQCKVMPITWKLVIFTDTVVVSRVWAKSSYIMCVCLWGSYCKLVQRLVFGADYSNAESCHRVIFPSWTNCGRVCVWGYACELSNPTAGWTAVERNFPNRRFSYTLEFTGSCASIAQPDVSRQMDGVWWDDIMASSFSLCYPRW